MPSEYALCFEGFRRRVWVAHEVVEIWQSHRQTRSHDPESFGALLAETSTDKRELWIESVTTPMSHDSQSRYHFRMSDPGHQRTAEAEFQEQEGSRIYIGTWHTHPESSPTPSCVDKSDWRKCLKRNKKRPLLFVIVGIEETRIFVPWGRFFRQLQLKENHSG